MARPSQGEPEAPLPPSFYRRGTVVVARSLLGCRLVRRLPGGELRRAVIVETEAYLGVEDRACHTWGGRRTARVEPMWGPGGHAYVYRIYGLHDCFNVVTRDAGEPEAVLVRAAVPEAVWRGEEVAREARLAASGPGKLCRHLAIGRELSGASLQGPDLFVSRGSLAGREVLVGPRVGVDYAGDAAAWPLRFRVRPEPLPASRRASSR